MNLQAILAQPPRGNSAVPQLRRERGWRLWLAPRPFAVVSTLVYIVSFVVLFGLCLLCLETGQDFLITGVFLALLALDRLDYWLFGEVPPARAGVLLLFLRILLAETLALTAGLPTAVFIYALLPYVASFYFGARGAYFMGVIAWVAVAGRMTVKQLQDFAILRETYLIYVRGEEFWGQYVGSLVGYTILVIFVVTAARIVLEEKASRARADRLLAERESSHWQLKAHAERALAATEERNRLARSIHDSLGHYLAAISVQVEKALAFRTIDAQQADQAAKDAKELASEALQGVRRSVNALRTPREVVATTWTDEGRRTKDDKQPGGDGKQARSRLATWLAPRPFDLVSTTVYLGTLAMDLGWTDPGEAALTWEGAFFVFAVLGLIILDRLDYFLFGEVPPPRAAAFFLGVRFLLLVGIGVIIGPWYTLWLVPIFVYYVFSYFGMKSGYWIGTLGWLILIAMFALTPLVRESARFNLEEFANSVSLLTLIMSVGIVTSRTVLKERAGRLRSEELSADIEEAQRQLKVYSEQSLTAAAERNHMAREIHDGLGHYLTVINVQLEKAIAFRRRDVEVADQALRDAERLTGEALGEVRRTMGTLRAQEAFHFEPALARLVENLRDSIPVELIIVGREDGFSRQSLMALYRAAQEGLTNAQKHSGANLATVQVTFAGEEATLTVSDNGHGFDPATLKAVSPDPQRSYGLWGVSERLELVGGTLDIESNQGQGTTLRITVPKDPLSHTPVLTRDQGSVISAVTPNP